MKNKTLLVLTYWSFKDALVQTYTLPYVRIIRKYLPPDVKIILVTSEQAHLGMTQEERAETGRDLKHESIELLTLNYRPFGLSGMLQRIADLIRLWMLCHREKVFKIHAWCTPAGMTGYLLSKLTGIPLVIDSYEPHAEAMTECGVWKRNGAAFKMLFWFEKQEAIHSSHLILCTAATREYIRKKFGHEIKNYSVKPACVDFDQFSPDKVKNKKLLSELQLEDKMVAVFSGKLGGMYLTTEFFSLLKAAYEYWGERFRALLLCSNSDQEINAYCEQAGLPSEIIIRRFVPHKNIADYIGLADFAVTPNIPVPSKRYGTPIKNGEYMAMGLPVIITANISDDSETIEKEQIGAVLRDLSETSYREAIRKIDALLKTPVNELRQKIRTVAESYRHFRVAERVYAEIYKQ